MSAPLAQTPPLGWNSWNGFGQKVNQDVILRTAEAMVANGMKDAGYEYVVIDDCWSEKSGRDANGDLVPDRERFADGIGALADEVHNLGLKLGIYSDAAELTCAEWPGSFGFEEQDAAKFAEWKVDFLKYDYCHAPKLQTDAIQRYTAMGEALQGCGREILFSACEWGGRAPWTWARDAGAQMWRVTGDVVDAWIAEKDWALGIGQALDKGGFLHEYAGPGGWNDMDMLVVGVHGSGHTDKGATEEEYWFQMAMWCVLASPLMAGCDLTQVDAQSLEMMLNPGALAIDQDSLGKQGFLTKKMGDVEVWRKPLSGGEHAIAIVNRGEVEEERLVDLEACDLADEGPFELFDVREEKAKGELRKGTAFTVKPHACRLMRATL